MRFKLLNCSGRMYGLPVTPRLSIVTWSMILSLQARGKRFDQETPSRNGYASFRRWLLVLSSKLSRAFRTPKGFVWPRGGAFAAAIAASLDFRPISGL